MPNIREARWKWWVMLAATILAGTDVFRSIGEALKKHSDVLGTALVAVAQALQAGAWPVAAAVALYWLLDRRLRRAETPSDRGESRLEGAFDTGLQPGELNWEVPSQIFFTEMMAPTFRASTDKKLTAEFFIGTHQRLPEGTRLVKWSVNFNLGGQLLPERTFEKNDIHLQAVGRTKLYPSPEVPVGDDLFCLTPIETLKGQQLSVSCEVFVLVRVPGLAHDVKFNEPSWTQVCRVQ